MISVNQMYDINGNPIKTGMFSVIQGTEGVYYVDFRVHLENTGEIALTISDLSGTPLDFANTLTSLYPVNLEPGASVDLITDKIYIGNKDGIYEYVLDLTADYVYAGQTHHLYESGSIQLDIRPDPVAGLSMTFESSAETGDLYGMVNYAYYADILPLASGHLDFSGSIRAIDENLNTYYPMSGLWQDEYGGYTMLSLDLGEVVSLDSANVLFELPSNTSGEWRISASEDGYDYSPYTIYFEPGFDVGFSE